MVGRIRKFKYSLHAYSISFLVNFLKNKNINFLDLAGYNPVPRNEKGKGIKKFKKKFYGQVIYQPTFIMDRTFLIKYIRNFMNKINKKNSFPDETFF